MLVVDYKISVLFFGISFREILNKCIPIKKSESIFILSKLKILVFYNIIYLKY